MEITHEELVENIALKLAFALDPQNKQEQSFCALGAAKLTNFVERNNLVHKWQAVVDAYIAIAKRNKKLSVFDIMDKLKQQLQNKSNTTGVQL